MMTNAAMQTGRTPAQKITKIYDSLISYRDDDELLSREREYELTYRWQQENDYSARNQIILAYSRLAKSCAKRASRSGLDYHDLYQEASEGMIYALDRFDPQRGNGFGTFARYHIINNMQMYALSMLTVMRIFNTAATKTLLAKFNTMKNSIEQRTGRSLDDQGRDEICTTLGVSRDQLNRFETAISGVVLIDTGAGNAPDDTTRALELPSNPYDDNGDHSAITRLAQKQTLGIFYSALETLPQRERNIIKARYLRESTKTLDSLSKTLGISRERVRQIEIKAMAQIGQYMRARGINSIAEIYAFGSSE